MVKSRIKNNRKRSQKQGKNEGHGKARRIRASTRHGYTDEYLSPYGGLLPLVKLWDALKFEDLFKKVYIEPGRQTAYGSLFFIKGLLVLLFIGFCCLFRSCRPLIPEYVVHLIQGCRPGGRSEATLGKVLYTVVTSLSQGGM